MPITFAIVESTPNRLRYLMTNTGETSFPASGTLANATLQADAIDGTPMAALVASAATDQAAAAR